MEYNFGRLIYDEFYNTNLTVSSPNITCDEIVMWNIASFKDTIQIYHIPGLLERNSITGNNPFSP